MALTSELRQRDFFVTRPLGTGHSNPHDVLRTRAALNVTGHAHSPPDPSKIFDPSLIRSLDDFQRDWGLKQDSIIEPGGPTESSLELAVAATRAAGSDGADLLRGPVSVLNRHGIRFDLDPDNTSGPVLWRDRDGNQIPLTAIRTLLAEANVSNQAETARRGIQLAAMGGPSNTISDAVPPPVANNPALQALAARMFDDSANSNLSSAPPTETANQYLPVGINSSEVDTGSAASSTGVTPAPSVGGSTQLAQRGGSDPWVVKGAMNSGTNNLDFDPWPTSPINRRFRFELHKKESSDRNYQSKGSKGLGRYQMTPIGLREAGMKDKKGNWTGKYGIRSENDFLNDPLAQEKALADLMRENDRYTRFYKLDQHYGRNIDGVKGKFTVTRNGMMAALHREGNGTVRGYFGFLQRNGWKTTGVSMPKKYEHVETRLRQFESIPYDQP